MIIERDSGSMVGEHVLLAITHYVRACIARICAITITSMCELKQLAQNGVIVI
jgi:hypothetical protein